MELLVGLTLEAKNVLASILGSYLQERNNDEKITQCLCVETLACFYETYAIISLLVSAKVKNRYFPIFDLRR